MGVSKVEFAGNTLIDLTGDTVQPRSLVAGYTATNSAGEKIEGEFIPIYFGDEEGIETVPLNADTLEGYSLENLMLKLYPVGSIYMSVNNVSPTTLFGGTWERIEDTFLLASGSTYSAGSTGGEASHTLTVDEMPNHNHKSMMWRDGGTSSFGVNNSGNGTFRFTFSSGASDDNIYTSYVGGSQSHNNMPPYLAVNVWKRTA